jgi:hypothetical protein
MAMKLSKNCRYLVRVRDYETVHIEVGAEISHFDMGFDNEDWAGLTQLRRERCTETLHNMLDKEVDRIARAELKTVAQWSEINPNLAEDYLETPPPTTMQRNNHAKKIDTHPAPSGGLRRRATSPTPIRPA